MATLVLWNMKITNDFSNSPNYPGVNFIIAGNTIVYYNGNVRCHHWRPRWRHEDSWFWVNCWHNVKRFIRTKRLVMENVYCLFCFGLAINLPNASLTNEIGSIVNHMVALFLCMVADLYNDLYNDIAELFLKHYCDVIMGVMRLKSPALRLFSQPFIQAQIKGKIKATRHWPLCGKFTGNWWISRTNGQ